MLQVDSVVLIPVHEIYAGAENNIREMNNLELEELKASIRVNGQKEPGLVCMASPAEIEQYGKKYILISGFRRFTAVSELKLQGYKCIVSTHLTEDERTVLNFTENYGRKQLNFYESMKPLIKYAERGWSEQQVMSTLGVSRSWVQPRMQLARMVVDGHTKICDLGKRMDFTYQQVRDLNSISEPMDLDNKLLELEKQLNDGVAKPRISKTDVKTKQDVASMLMERTKPMREALILWASGAGIPTWCWNMILVWSNARINDYDLMDYFDQLIHDPRLDDNLKDVFDDLDSYADDTEKLYHTLVVIKKNAEERTYSRPINGFPQK